MSEDTYGDDEYDEDDVLAVMSTGHFCLQCTMSTMYNVYNVQCLQGIIVYNVQCTMYLLCTGQNLQLLLCFLHKSVFFGPLAF